MRLTDLHEAEKLFKMTLEGCDLTVIDVPMDLNGLHDTKIETPPSSVPAIEKQLEDALDEVLHLIASQANAKVEFKIYDIDTQHMIAKIDVTGQKQDLWRFYAKYSWAIFGGAAGKAEFDTIVEPA